MSRRDVTREEHRMIIWVQLSRALVTVTLWALGLWAFGWWGGLAGVVVGLALARRWRARHLELVERVERRRSK